MVERAAALVAEAGQPTKASRALIAAAGAPGENMVSGRLALAQAYRGGKLGPDDGKSAALLQSLAASLDPAPISNWRVLPWKSMLFMKRQKPAWNGLRWAVTQALCAFFRA